MKTIILHIANEINVNSSTASRSSNTETELSSSEPRGHPKLSALDPGRLEKAAAAASLEAMRLCTAQGASDVILNQSS